MVRCCVNNSLLCCYRSKYACPVLSRTWWTVKTCEGQCAQTDRFSFSLRCCWKVLSIDCLKVENLLTNWQTRNFAWQSTIAIEREKLVVNILFDSIKSNQIKESRVNNVTRQNKQITHINTHTKKSVGRNWERSQKDKDKVKDIKAYNNHKIKCWKFTLFEGESAFCGS